MDSQHPARKNNPKTVSLCSTHSTNFHTNFCNQIYSNLEARLYSEPHPLPDCRKRSPGTQQQKSLSHTATPLMFVPWIRTCSGCPRASQSTHLMVNWAWHTPCNLLGPVFPHTPETHKQQIGLQLVQHTAQPNDAAWHMLAVHNSVRLHTNACGSPHNATCKEGMHTPGALLHSFWRAVQGKGRRRFSTS